MMHEICTVTVIYTAMYFSLLTWTYAGNRFVLYEYTNNKNIHTGVYLYVNN